MTRSFKFLNYITPEEHHEKTINGFNQFNQSCSVGKSAQTHVGIFLFFSGTAYWHVFIQWSANWVLDICILSVEDFLREGRCNCKNVSTAFVFVSVIWLGGVYLWTCFLLPSFVKLSIFYFWFLSLGISSLLMCD